MDYMGVVWTAYSDSTFYQNCCHFEQEYLASQDDIIQLKQNLNDSVTFRALVRHAKINRCRRRNFRIFSSAQFLKWEMHLPCLSQLMAKERI